MNRFDIVSLQDAIVAKVKSLTAAQVYQDMVPDDHGIEVRDGQIVPYVVLRFGPMRPGYTGKSMAGPRHDEYWASVDIVAISSNGRVSRVLLNGLVDELIGFKPDGVAPLQMRTDAGDPAQFVVASNESQPTQHVAATRLRYTVNSTAVGVAP